MSTSLTRFTLIAAITALLVSAAGSSTVAHRNHGPRNVDLNASAHPGPGAAEVTDSAFHNGGTRSRHLKADTTAVASSTCDDCAAAAQALEILYVGSVSKAVLDNTAVAWSQCANCRAGSLSVQVVVVRKGRSVTANNRASAVNVACENCSTAAAAYQLVVVGDADARLSPRAVRELRAWVDQEAAALGTAAGTAPRSLARMEGEADSGQSPLELMVNEELRSTTLSMEVDVEAP